MAIELIRAAASILLSSGSIWVIVALIQMVILGAFVNENASDGRSKLQSLPDAKKLLEAIADEYAVTARCPTVRGTIGAPVGLRV